jgi:hypothetical protein
LEELAQMKRRGSAMIFAIVLVVSMTTVVVATVWLTSSLVRDERIYEDQTRMKYSIDGATEQVVQDYAAGTLVVLPSTRNTTINGVSCALTITDNSSNVPHTLSVVSTASYKGRTISETKIVGMRKTPTPFYYALFVNGGLTSSATVTTGASSANGDIYSNGAISLTGTGSTINGDLESTSTQSIGTTTITGTQYPSTTAITFPTVVSTNYSSFANQSTGSSTIGNTTFSTTTGAYYLLYGTRTSGVSIAGTFTGKGTIFVNGPVTISGPISLANSSSRVAIIANGTITFSSSGPHSAYFYGTTCTLPTGGISITKGALVVNSLSTTNQPITITNDTSVWLSLTEGVNQRLPGLYP